MLNILSLFLYLTCCSTTEDGNALMNVEADEVELMTD